MIAVDTNILVYAHRRDSPWHDSARKVISDLVATRAAWAIPSICVYELYATITRPRYYRPPSTVTQAVAQIDAWLECPTLTLLGEDAGTWHLVRDLAAAARIEGLAVQDARVVAACLRHGVSELWTHDRDFSRFPSLRTRNPLVDIQPTRAGEKRASYGEPTAASSSRSTSAAGTRRSSPSTRIRSATRSARGKTPRS